MGTKVRIEFLSEGFREVLNSHEVEAELLRRAQRIANAAGPGFEASVYQGSFGGGRHVASVRTTDHESRLAEAEDKALSHAIDAGR